MNGFIPFVLSELYSGGEIEWTHVSENELVAILAAVNVIEVPMRVSVGEIKTDPIRQNETFNDGRHGALCSGSSISSS